MREDDNNVYTYWSPVPKPVRDLECSFLDSLFFEREKITFHVIAPKKSVPCMARGACMRLAICFLSHDIIFSSLLRFGNQLQLSRVNTSPNCCDYLAPRKLSTNQLLFSTWEGGALHVDTNWVCYDP